MKARKRVSSVLAIPDSSATTYSPTDSATRSSSTPWTSRWRRGTRASTPSIRGPSCGPSSSNLTHTYYHSMTRWICVYGISGSTRPSNSSTVRRYSSIPVDSRLSPSYLKCSSVRRKSLNFELQLYRRNPNRSTNSTTFLILSSAQWPTKSLSSPPTMCECTISLLAPWRNCSPNCTSPTVKPTLQHASSGSSAEDFSSVTLVALCDSFVAKLESNCKILTQEMRLITKANKFQKYSSWKSTHY